MEPLVLVGLGSFVVLLVVVLALSQPQPRRRFDPDRAYEAQAEVEATDIEQMIEARNAIRRRRGLPEIGDDLAAQLRDRLDE